MNLTLSVDRSLLERARRAAKARGKSVNQLVREYLEQMAAEGNAQSEIAELRELSGTGHRGDWTFDRDELHERT